MSAPEGEAVVSPGAPEREFGPYGGRFVPETLIPALDELERAWLDAGSNPAFAEELAALLRDYAGRPTPLYLASSLSEACGSTVYLKREDLLHTGAHKINNALGQALLARRMGKRRVIAETGAGQHGVATATGTEAAPGRKDPAKLVAFFRAVEAASTRLETPVLGLEGSRPAGAVAGARP